MKLIPFIITLLSFANTISAQNLVLINHNCKVSSKDLSKVQKILKYEAKFYNNLFNSAVNDTLTIKVNLYGNRADYESVKGKAAPGLHRTNGFYTSISDECYVVKNSDYLATIIHEASHCFLQHNIPNNSRFLTEGIAEFFETLDLGDNGEIVFSAQPARVKMVKEIVNSGSFKLSAYAFAGPGRWGEKEQFQTLYSVAYSVIYFLIKKNPSALKQMLLFIQEGQSFEKAIDYGYGGYKNFENEFVSFYKSTLIKPV